MSAASAPTKPPANHSDRILINNPVIMQGMGLAPLVVAASEGRDSLILASAVVLLLIPTRVLGAFLSNRLPRRLSPLCYAGTASVLYIPIYYLLELRFGATGLLHIGSFLPLLVVDPLLFHRYAGVRPEQPSTAFRRGLFTTLGYCLVLVLCACLRELLALGTVFGSPVLPVSLFPLASQPCGGFILVGAVCAAWRGCVRAYTKRVHAQGRHTA